MFTAADAAKVQALEAELQQWKVEVGHEPGYVAERLAQWSLVSDAACTDDARSSTP